MTGNGRFWHLARTPDIEVETIFLAFDFLTRQLRAHGSVLTTITYTLPGGRRLRRLPPERLHWRLGVGDVL
jgi:hypothetical protein